MPFRQPNHRRHQLLNAGGLTGGTSITSPADGDFLQYDGTAWVNTPNLYIENGNALRIYDSADTDYGEFTHNGSDLVLNTTNTSYFVVEDAGFQVWNADEVKFNVAPGDSRAELRDGFAFRILDATDTDYLQLSDDGSLSRIVSNNNSIIMEAQGGSAVVAMWSGTNLRVYDSTNTDYVDMGHDGTDFNTTFTNTTEWNIAVPSGGVVLETSTGDCALYLKADTDNNTETDNPYIRFEQDGNLVDGIIGLTGAADVDAQGNTFTGGVNNTLAIHCPFSSGAVVLGHTGVALAKTVAASSGGLQVNNTSTGSGFERVLTTSDSAGGSGVTKYKTADESVTSSTLQDDNHLTGYSLTAAAWYAIEGAFYFTSASATPDFKCALSFTNTPNVSGLWGCVATDTISALDGDAAATTGQFDINIAAGGAINGHFAGGFQANSSTGGTVKLQWAQRISDATATTLKAGSWMRITQIS